jgi:hypothetical protein
VILPMKSWAHVLRLRAPSGVGDPMKKYSKDGSQVKIPGLDKVQEGSQCKESLVSSTPRS